MGSQKVKAKEEAPAQEVKEVKKPVSREAQVKKWKGKEWFSVVAPSIFDQKVVGEIPATDPESLVGRTVEVNLAELTDNPARYTMKLNFKVTKVDGNTAMTEFHGLHLMKENIFRMVRKRTSKVEIMGNVKTADQWLLHLKIYATLNRECDTEVQRKIRLATVKFLEDFASKSSLEDFVKTAGEGLIQKNIKKFGSKIYPIRFCEIIKMEVIKAGKAA